MSRSSRILAKDKLFNQANAAWDQGDLPTAFHLFTKAAEAGDSSSQLDLGYFFDCGLHVQKDKDQALQWYHQAYRQGNADAANNIATVHRDRRSYGKMIWWFRRALAMGNHDSLLDLGKAYEAGVGVPRNPRNAQDCYHRLLGSNLVTEFSREQAAKRLSKLDVKKKKNAAAGRTKKNRESL